MAHDAGSELVSQLCAHPKWDSVTCVGRRPFVEPGRDPPFEAGAWKLRSVVTDMDNIESNKELASALSEASSTFCALGATRGAAGSAGGFRHVDLDMVAAAAKASKNASVRHFSLVSAQGASASCWYNDWKLFHPLLYVATKGQAEEAVKALDFSYLTVVRPGILERGDFTRSAERWALRLLPFMSSISTATLAGVMIEDAVACHEGRRESQPVKTYEMKELLNASL